MTENQPAHIQHEIIDSKELAERWNVPRTWIGNMVRSNAVDPIPHVKLGKYLRFEWGSEPLQQWWNSRRKHYSPQSHQPPAQKRGDPGELGRRLARQVLIPRGYGR